MPAARRSFAALSVAAVLAAVPTAALASAVQPTNGIEKLSATSVLARSVDALAQVKNLVVVGELDYGKQSISFSVRSSGRGAKVAGTLTIRSGKTSVGPVAFVDLPSALYLRAGAGFWHSELASIKHVSAAKVKVAVAKIAGKWIKVTGKLAKTFSSSFGELTEPGKFAQSLLKGNGTLRKGSPKVVRDQHVLPIVSSDGATIFIALVGTPIPVEISGTSKLNSSSVSLAALINTPPQLAIQAPHRSITIASLTSAIAG